MKKTAWLLILCLFALHLQGAPRTRALVVFPFVNQSGNASLGWISEGFAALLGTRLADPDRYLLSQRERNAAYEELGLPPGSPLTLASEYEVAQTLGVDWAVLGSFDVQGNRLVARVQLLDMRRMKLSPPLDATGELADLEEISARLAWRLLSAYDPNFVTGKEEDFRRQSPEVRLDAFENYIRGLLATDPNARVHYLTEADRRDPSDHRAALELGRFYFDQKDYSSAVPWLKKAQPSDAGYGEALFLLGVSEYFLGHDADAEKRFAELAQRFPLNEVYNNLGVMEFHEQHYAEALASFDRARAGDPTDPQFCFNRAACLWYLQRYADAAQALEQAVKADDQDAEAHTLLATVYGRLHDAPDRARQVRWLDDHSGSPGLAADPPEDDSPQPRLKKNFDGQAFRLLSLTLRNTLEARLSGEPVAQHAAAHSARGRMFLAEERFQEAERELQEAASLQPNDSEIHLLLGEAYEGEERHTEALGELETSLRLKNTVSVHVWLGRAFLSLNRLEEARLQGQAALELDPGNSDAERLMTQIQDRAAKLRRAP